MVMMVRERECVIILATRGSLFSNVQSWHFFKMAAQGLCNITKEGALNVYTLSSKPLEEPVCSCEHVVRRASRASKQGNF